MRWQFLDLVVFGGAFYVHWIHLIFAWSQKNIIPKLYTFIPKVKEMTFRIAFSIKSALYFETCMTYIMQASGLTKNAQGCGGTPATCIHGIVDLHLWPYMQESAGYCEKAGQRSPSTSVLTAFLTYDMIHRKQPRSQTQLRCWCSKKKWIEVSWQVQSH